MHSEQLALQPNETKVLFIGTIGHKYAHLLHTLLQVVRLVCWCLEFAFDLRFLGN